MQQMSLFLKTPKHFLPHPNLLIIPLVIEFDFPGSFAKIFKKLSHTFCNFLLSFSSSTCGFCGQTKWTFVKIGKSRKSPKVTFYRRLLGPLSTERYQISVGISSFLFLGRNCARLLGLLLSSARGISTTSFEASGHAERRTSSAISK